MIYPFAQKGANPSLTKKHKMIFNLENTGLKMSQLPTLKERCMEEIIASDPTGPTGWMLNCKLTDNLIRDIEEHYEEKYCQDPSHRSITENKQAKKSDCLGCFLHIPSNKRNGYSLMCNPSTSTR